jgi:hypothetical protein
MELKNATLSDFSQYLVVLAEEHTRHSSNSIRFLRSPSGRRVRRQTDILLEIYSDTGMTICGSSAESDLVRSLTDSSR